METCCKARRETMREKRATAGKDMDRAVAGKDGLVLGARGGGAPGDGWQRLRGLSWASPAP